MALQELEAKRKTAAAELAPEALTTALEAWRTRLADAQQTDDILGMKYFLTRFVSKIEVDYHTARLFYTYPIDDLNSLMHDVMSWGHLENSEFSSEFSLKALQRWIDCP